jgi:hypothetical protein
MEMHIHLAEVESELASAWDMPMRWTFFQGQIVYDPDGKLDRLLADKVPLKAEEKRWLKMCEPLEKSSLGAPPAAARLRPAPMLPD